MIENLISINIKGREITMTKIRLIKPSLEIKLFKKAISNTKKKSKSSDFNEIFKALEDGSKKIEYSAIPVETFKANKLNTINPEYSEEFIKKITEVEEEVDAIDSDLDGQVTYLFNFHSENIRVPATINYIKNGRKAKAYVSSVAITDCGEGRYLISFETETNAPIGKICVIPMYFSFEKKQWYASDYVVEEMDYRAELEVATLGASLMAVVYNYETAKEEGETIQDYVVRNLLGLVKETDEVVQEASEQLDDVLSILNGGLV